MKNIKLLAGLLLMFTAFTFTSCENEPIDGALNLDDFNTPPTGPAVFKADFSGSTWVATTSIAVLEGNYLQISAGKPNGEGFAFLVEGTAVGTYPANTNLLAFTPANTDYGYWSNNTDNPSEDTGSITISNIDTVNHTISGTFHYKGYWSDDTVTSILPILFTNGEFQNIPYIVQQQTGDTFFAKVNGTEFVDTDILTATFTAGTGQEWLSIAAEDASTNSITVSVKSDVTPGTYQITGNVAVDSAQGVYSVDGTDFDSVSGSVTIISKTADRIKGTFSFVGSDGTTTTPITEGSFDAGY
ncbi:DUF6252 family protein [Flavobacterium sp.]|uniref:DUF6252 family protein n=1 Tax=Flavobacterium sp. TaxID=239 RepID=UPI002FD9DEAE